MQAGRQYRYLLCAVGRCGVVAGGGVVVNSVSSTIHNLV